MVSMPRRGGDVRTIVAFVGVVWFGASNIVAVRLSNRELEPLWGAGLRFAIAALVMFGLVALRRLPLPRGRSFTGAVALGVLAFGLAYGLFYIGTQHVPAGLAAVILGAVPLLTLALAWVQGQEAFRWRAVAGALLALVGIALFTAEPPGGAVPIVSVLLVLACSVSAAQAGILVKGLPDSHPITTNAIAMATGSVLLLVWAFVVGESAALPTSPSVWSAVAYLALIGSPLLFVCYLVVLERWTASAAAYQFVLFPPLSAVLGALMLDEPLTRGLALGVPFVLLGVWVGALASDRSRSA